VVSIAENQQQQVLKCEQQQQNTPVRENGKRILQPMQLGIAWLNIAQCRLPGIGPP
jgi:hypothetical protein